MESVHELTIWLEREGKKKYLLYVSGTRCWYYEVVPVH